jgi:catechol 2,3-dioxygenase
VVLTLEPTHGLNHFGFKVTDRADLDHYRKRLDKAGVEVTKFKAGEWAEGHGESIRFALPGGHQMELVHGMQQVGNLLPLTNPPPRPMGLAGMAPPRLDHVFLTAEEVDHVTDFLTEHLDFRLTEQVLADDGFKIASWLEVSHKSHDLAVITGPNHGLHHFAFWVDGWNDLRTAADVCAYHGVNLETNPTRQGVTRGQSLYFFDPVGNRNEMFTGGYWVDPDAEPVTWTEAELGRALFYYDGVVNQKFLTVHS